MAVSEARSRSARLVPAAVPRSSSGEHRARSLWCMLAMAASLLFALRTSASALVDPLVVQEDARQHVFWVPRLHDPELFRGDPIADYYQAVAPPGFTAVYFLGTLAFDTVTFSKLLPLALTPVLSGFGFLLGWRLFRRADAAGLGATLLAWSVWQYDDLASATPRSFTTPLLVAHLAFLAGRQWATCLAVVVIQALLYPPGAAIMLAIQALWLLGRAREQVLSPSYRKEAYWLGFATLLATALMLLDQGRVAAFGPMVSVEQARAMPEFQWSGRAGFFTSDPFKFWLLSTRSGVSLVPKDQLEGAPPWMILPYVLLAALGGWALAGHLGLVTPPRLPRRSWLLPCILAASLLLFALAHALLFRLYLPTRYVQFSLPIVLALGGGLSLALFAERLARRWGRPGPLPRGEAARRRTHAAMLPALGAFALLLLLGLPAVDYYRTGYHPALYEYLRSQPKQTLVAALPTDSVILPVFGQRPVLVSRQHAIPYHLGYYLPLRRRTQALLSAYYAESPLPMLELVEREGVDLIVANLDALEQQRQQRGSSALGLQQLARECAALRDRELVAIPVACARGRAR